MKRPRVLLLNISDIGCRSTSKMAAQSHSHSHSTSTNKIELSFFRYSDWLSKQVGIAKKMREVLRKWTPREKYIFISKFSDTISFFIIPGMFRRNLARIGRSKYPITSLKVNVFLPKSNTAF